MRAFSLARLEMGRFARGRLPRAAMVALLLLPLLYGALYLWSFWDPTGHINRLPVALVNEDKQVTAEGEKVNAGHDLVDKLMESKTFDWQETSAADAAKGVADGKYYLSLTIPADFSKNIAGTNSDHPRRGVLQVRTNDSNNYIVGSISKTVFTQIRAGVSANASAKFYDKIFVGFADLHDQTKKAADGATQLADGAAQAHQGASKLADGSAQAKQGADTLASKLGEAQQGADKIADGNAKARQGADQLAGGSAQAKTGADKLASGAGQISQGNATLSAGLDQAKAATDQLTNGVSGLDTNLAKLSTGAQQVAAGTQQIADQVNPIADQVSPVLHTYSKQIQDAAKLTADAAQAVADDLRGLPAKSAAALAQARTAAADADAALAKCRATTGMNCDAAAKVAQVAHQLVPIAQQFNDLVQQAAPELNAVADKAANLQRIAADLAATDPAAAFDAKVKDLNRLNDGAHAVADGAAQISQGVHTQLLPGMNRLDGGLGDLADGARKLSGATFQLSNGMQLLADANGRIADGNAQLADGLAPLADGTRQLADGTGRLAAGSNKLADANGQIADGNRQLADGTGQLADGTGQLASGLHDGVAKIPDYNSAQRDARSAAMSDPVDLARQELNKAPNYGTGFAPYFIPLALWVGAMVTYMLFRPLSPRALAANAPAWRVALAGWLPAAGIGFAQAAALLAVLHWAIGLDMVHTAGVIGYLALTVVSFTAIMQLVNAKFGPAGRLLALALLMLQLTSAGGTYPVQTSPDFFNAIHPYLPMTYVIAGLRRLISGGDLGAVWTGSLVLLAFWAGALALSVLTARGKQMWSMSRLHPELSL